MFQDEILAQHLAEHGRRLLGDGGEGDGGDDAAEALRAGRRVVEGGMVEGEAERGQRLAAAGRHVQREEAGRHRGLGPHMREDAGAQDGELALRLAEAGDLRPEAVPEGRQAGGEARPVAIRLRAAAGQDIETFRRLAVGIDQGAEQHAAEQGQLEREEIPLRRQAEALRKQIRQVERQHHAPGGIEPFDETVARDAGRKIGLVRAAMVRQAGMVTGHHRCHQLRHDPVLVPAGHGERAFGFRHQQGSAGRRMVDPDPVIRQP
nr:hypothetical protein [Aureimonas endophytica]